MGRSGGAEGETGLHLVETARQTVSQGIGHLVQRYAIAYDGYLTTDGSRTDAAFVKAGEQGKPEAVTVAQRYRVKKRAKGFEKIGPPTIIESAEQLLGRAADA